MLTDEEAEIGDRIRIAREHYGTSRQLVAEQMGLSRQQIDRIERGEVAVRFRPAILFCRFAGINPLWLAFGEPENRFGFFWIMHDPSSQKGYRVLANVTRIAALEMAADSLFLGEIQRNKELYSAASRSLTSKEGPGWGVLAPPFAHENKVLDAAYHQPIVVFQMSQKKGGWEALRDRIRAATPKRGDRVKLAREFGVTPQAVAKWLSGASAPTAETTLQLLEWVTAEEAQQKKSSGGVSETRPERKTRTRKSKHEQPRSGPEKA